MDKLNFLLNKFQSFLNLSFDNYIQFKTNKSLGKVGVGGFLLGLFLGGSIVTLIFSIILTFIKSFSTSFLISLIHWNLYFTGFVIFHFLEFLVTALYQPFNVSYDSYLINHSKTYTLASIFCFIEFWIESFFFQKWNTLFVIIGIILVCGGQFIRTLAMSTCGENFSHLIMNSRNKSSGDKHQLVKTGVYSILRHPSYFGWFYWSIGTQILLCNPISFILYTYASWKFFSDRIPYEEEVLIACYKNEYVEYSQSTIIGIPFVSGAQLSSQLQSPKNQNNTISTQSHDSPQSNQENDVDQKID